MLCFKVNQIWSYSILSIILFCFVNRVRSQRSQYKRCYSCRSRGPLGDCKDPFEFNSTNVEQTGVETPFCSSGWCGKSIEGEDEGQHLMATERMCLQRPPSDNKERCAQTFYGNKKKSFFMCFCKGDLCNGGHKPITSSLVLGFCLISFYLFAKIF